MWIAVDDDLIDYAKNFLMYFWHAVAQITATTKKKAKLTGKLLATNENIKLERVSRVAFSSLDTKTGAKQNAAKA